MRLKRPASSSAGFTLMEILVVLVIASLVSGMLIVAFQQIMGLRLRLAAFLDGTDTPTLVAEWFRSSVDGLIIDPAEGAQPFAGDSHSLSGRTLAPLDGKAGV